MRNLRTENEIRLQWREYPAAPMVSICCTTYNHEQYIEDALVGFLIQETDFSFEILVHDDASTDKTTDILREYEVRYPSLIKVIYQSVNQYSKGRKPGRINLERAKGKYIAPCEGDDYWLDSSKLQKQVDFLEINKDVGLIHTNGFRYYTTIKKRKIVAADVKIKSILNCRDRDIFLSILIGKYNILTCSTCFRSNLFAKIDFDDFYGKNFKMGDTFLWLELAYVSKVSYLPEPMVVHNILEESASKSKDMKKILAFSQSGFELEKYVAYKYNLSLSIQKDIAFRRNRIFLDISYRGKLFEEGIKAYKELISIYPNQKGILIDYVKYITLRHPKLFNVTPKLIKFMNRLQSFYRERILLKTQ